MPARSVSSQRLLRGELRRGVKEHEEKGHGEGSLHSALRGKKQERKLGWIPSRHGSRSGRKNKMGAQNLALCFAGA